MKKAVNFILAVILLFLIFPAEATSVIAAQTNAGVEMGKQLRKPVRQDALSGDQKEEGWVLVGGYAYPPEAMEGDAGISAVGSPGSSDRDSLVNVTFAADIPAGQTEPFIIYITNSDTFREYYIELYASNEYTAKSRLPAGAYFFTGGGPENDYMSLYNITTPKSFIAEPGADVLVKPVIRSRGEALNGDKKGETDTTVSADISEETSTAVNYETEKRSAASWRKYVFPAVIFLGIGCLLGIAGLYKSRKEDIG